MYLYKVITIGEITFYVKSDIRDLSEFAIRAKGHFGCALKYVEYVSSLTEVN